MSEHTAMEQDIRDLRVRAEKAEARLAELTSPADFTVMNDGAILDWLGTDALRWAQAFEHFDQPADPNRVGGLIAWFANALEAGRTQGRRELCTHDRPVKLAADLTICGTCGQRLD